MIDDLDFRSLLRQWSAEAIAHSADVGLSPTAEQVESQWIGNPPATADQIASAQSRLGRPLPESVREFYSITNGWPITSFDFGRIVAVDEVGWFSEVDPVTFDVWSEISNDDDDPDSYAAILARSVLISGGTDKMLLDTGRPAEPDWLSFGLTSWYPGIDDEQPNLRAGLQSHYENFSLYSVARDE